MVVTIGSALYFRNVYDVAGLALAMALGNAVSSALLLLIITRRVDMKGLTSLAGNLMVFVLGALVAGLAARGTLFVLAGTLIPTERVWGLFVQATAATVVGAGAYFLAMKLAGVPEVEAVWNKIRAFRLPADVREIVVEEHHPEEELPR
jgi:peptidoglycan biosynthesis protein MviN/MurJ (putative lipid II flippase)